MCTVIPFPGRRPVPALGPDDLSALDRLVARLQPEGAVGWEADGARVYVVGAEGETLLIVAKAADGVAVLSGFAARLLWRGERLAGYA